MLIALVLFGCSHDLSDCEKVYTKDVFFETISACESSIPDQPNISINAPVSLSYCVEVKEGNPDALAHLNWQLTKTGPVLKNT